jgi:subtilisin family serine protease
LATSYNGTDESLLEDDACEQSSISSSVKGKIFLVKFGTCTIPEKLANVKKAGGLGVIFYNSIPNDNNLRPSTVEKPALPFVIISYIDSLRLLKAFKQTSPTMLKFSYDLENHFVPNELASTISYFSSVGPSADLVMKPDIAAVGDEVYSTMPGYLGGYGFKKGTSMACPYVAGSVALYLQYHGTNSSSSTSGLVFQKFKNYASQVNVQTANSGNIDSTLRQGAGLVQGK